MLVACHQPNFIPWFPFFEKMNIADKFIILKEVQYEKGGWQNRCKINEMYWTNPVRHGMLPIKEKMYSNGTSLLQVNMDWIYAIAKTLGINTEKIILDERTDLKGSERIAHNVESVGGDSYLTNPDAFDKYLDRKPFDDRGIEIVEFTTRYTVHTFEMFEKYGIEGTRAILEKSKEDFLCRTLLSSSAT